MRLRADRGDDRALLAGREAPVPAAAGERRGLRDLHRGPRPGRQGPPRRDGEVLRRVLRRRPRGPHGGRRPRAGLLGPDLRAQARGVRPRPLVLGLHAGGGRRLLPREPRRHAEPQRRLWRRRQGLLVAHEGWRGPRRAQRHDHRVRPLHAGAARHGGLPRRAGEPPRGGDRRRVGWRLPVPVRRQHRRRDRGAAQRGRFLLAQGCPQQDVPHEGDAPRQGGQELLPEDEGRGGRAQRALLLRPLHRHRWTGHGHLHPRHQPQGGRPEVSATRACSTSSTTPMFQ
mmetsp:Transcript_149016/g.361826  ORF Transcript_149016/g.361826 Transcript_149016/m.361826 type:complete len:285 (-) Transcript_149016:34-888(-)